MQRGLFSGSFAMVNAVLEHLLGAPELALWEEQIAARLREERARRQQFYHDLTPSLKAEFINGGLVLEGPGVSPHF